MLLASRSPHTANLVPAKTLSLGQGLRCRSGSKVPDFVDKFPMTLLVEMLDPNVSKSVLRLREVDGDRAVLDQLLDKEVSQRRVMPEGSKCDCRQYEAPRCCPSLEVLGVLPFTSPAEKLSYVLVVA